MADLRFAWRRHLDERFMNHPLPHVTMAHATKQAPCAACRQRGVTLLEVLVAMLVFLVAASALVLLINNAYIANAQALRTFSATTTAQSLIATIEGDPADLGSLNNIQLGSSGSSASTAPQAIQTWWTAQTQAYPDLSSVGLTTNPTACNSTAPCQITAVIAVKSAFGGSIQHTFILQDGF